MRHLKREHLKTFSSCFPYFLEDWGQNGLGVLVLWRVLAIKPAELLQASQLQGVDVGGVVLSQVFVSLQLWGRREQWEQEFIRGRWMLTMGSADTISLTRAVISCRTWTSDKKSRSAWKSIQKNIRGERNTKPQHSALSYWQIYDEIRHLIATGHVFLQRV